jgi:hypothetical protein
MAKKQKKQEVYIPFELKADKNFKMAKQTKRFLALGKYKSEEDRSAFKRAMINAQLSEEAAKRQSFKREKEDVSA